MPFWTHRRKREDDLDEEIRIHLRMAASDHMDGGERADDAYWSARREFGNLELTKEVTREMWGRTSLEQLLQDVRYAARVLLRHWGFTAMAVFSLALGIGANTAIFSLIDAVMLERLPVKTPEQLVTIGDPVRTSSLHNGTTGEADLLSYPFFERLKTRNTVFSGVLARGRTERLTVRLADTAGAGEEEKTRCRFVSGNYFSVLGVPASRGRTFTDEETSIPGTAPVAVISDGFWARAFGRDPAAIGSRILVNGAPFTLIGVTPPRFEGETVGAPVDIWLPALMQAQATQGHVYWNNPGVNWLLLMGRLKPGVTIDQARTQVNLLGPGIFRELYQGKSPAEELDRLLKKRVQVGPGARGFSRMRRDFYLPLLALMALVTLVLLICCANISNLQLVRAAGRQREMNLRLAIGAGRARLIRQLLTESLLLALLGGALGLLCALYASRALLSLFSTDGQLPLDVHLNSPVLFFAFVTALAAALFSGLAPAWRASSVDLSATLKLRQPGQTDRSAGRLQSVFIVSQILLSVVLLAAAGSFLASLQNLRQADVGYARDRLLLARIDQKAAGYDSKTVNELTRRLLERLGRIPQVAAVTVSENGLFSGTDSESDPKIEGYANLPEAARVTHYDRVGPGYFSVVGTPVLAGRGIETQDTENSLRVAVINEQMARFYFPHQNPIGRHIFEGDSKDQVSFKIVGVVRDSKQNDLRGSVPRRYFGSFLQHVDDIDVVNVEVRTRGPAEPLMPAVRHAIRDVDSRLSIESLATADQLIEDVLQQEKLVARLSTVFGVLALLLASMGLYGVMSYVTARRTSEIGIRMALGAKPGGVIGMVMRETFLRVAIGIAAGLLMAAAFERLIGNLLFGLSVFPAIAMSSAAVLVVLAAALASFLPAWRASQIDPIAALRYE